MGKYTYSFFNGGDKREAKVRLRVVTDGKPSGVVRLKSNRLTR